MKNYTVKPIMAMVLVLILVACATVGIEEVPVKTTEGIPVEKSASIFTMANWLAVGPFPNISTTERQSDGTFDVGYSYDFLASIGGESTGVIKPNQTLQFENQDATVGTAPVVEATANPMGIVDFAELYNHAEYKVAYAFAYIHSTKDQSVHALLGSDDAVKVWTNGSLVHENYTFRAVNPGEDQFPIHLKKGLNSILVKVLNGTSGWGFSLSVQDAQSRSEMIAKDKVKKDFEAFMNSKIVPAWYNSWDESFTPGNFPNMRWDQPYLAEQIIGEAPLTIRWFDAELNEVTKAESPGRYGFIAECVSKENMIIRRAGTLYCYPWDWMGWSERPYATLKTPPAARFDQEQLSNHEEAIARYVGRMMLLSTLDQEEGAALMSYLYEVNHGKYSDGGLNSPMLADDEYHIRLQKKVGGIKYSGPSLRSPKAIQGKSAPVLRHGTPEDAGFNPIIIADLKAVTDEWFDASGEPFITVVARNGIIVYEEATGHDANGEFTTSTATPIASTTKLITGITFAQFMHQDLIQIDDPVGAYYPDYPLEGDKTLTLRHCFTHTSGLIGHERWGGMHNHRLENVVANQLNFLPVGKKSTYNGDGYNLAGRVMEAVAGKSIFRVIHENLFEPLDMSNSIIEEDLAFSVQSTAGDLARIGQLLLNRGSYGKYEFFSPAVFEQILPKNLAQFYPGMDWDQGIGITWMTMKHPDAGKDGTPTDKTVLSSNIIGHGSATSTVLRVDLDNDLVIAQTRWQAGPHYDKYLTKLLMAIEKNLK
ncbi:MAG: beta-lactamase family protein [Candidatus Marinimicrobia bacterium]|nr:beta-lactamase family protein [FCB group bacterium]MBL7024952.1 beta-lactamase family protein [Candidatus Neomarinimicrobiota bacterium]